MGAMYKYEKVYTQILCVHGTLGMGRFLHFHCGPTHTVHSVVRERVALIAVTIVGANSVDAFMDTVVVFPRTLVSVWAHLGAGGGGKIDRGHCTGLLQTYRCTVEPIYRGQHWDPAGCPV